MNKFLQGKSDEFRKIIDFFNKEISSIRTGRANPAILDNIMVDAYGAKSPINNLASITVSDARSLVVSPWDKNISKEIEKAVTAANLGVSIVNEGGKLRINIPLLTEETRRELVKKLNEKMEAARIALRKLRDELKDMIEAAEQAKEISEDDKFRFVKELDETISQKNEEIKSIRNSKEEEIMKI